VTAVVYRSKGGLPMRAPTESAPPPVLTDADWVTKNYGLAFFSGQLWERIAEDKS